MKTTSTPSTISRIVEWREEEYHPTPKSTHLEKSRLISGYISEQPNTIKNKNDHSGNAIRGMRMM